MINQAKSDKNNDIFLNFVADTLGLRDIKISDNFFLSLNFSKLAHVISLHIFHKIASVESKNMSYSIIDSYIQMIFF